MAFAKKLNIQKKGEACTFSDFFMVSVSTGKGRVVVKWEPMSPA